jgi:hypothetical protein
LGGEAAPIQDVSVDHGRFHILVAKELLHHPNVIAVLKQVGREAILWEGFALSECVAPHWLVDACRCRGGHVALDG